MDKKIDRMVHCSFDLVDRFEPRVPKYRVDNADACEDNITPRICVAPTIMSAVNAIPDRGNVIFYMDKLPLPILIHAYYLYSDEFIMPTSEQVPDVELTHEHLLCKTPSKIVRRDYILQDSLFYRRQDSNDIAVTTVYGGQLR